MAPSGLFYACNSDVTHCDVAENLQSSAQRVVPASVPVREYNRNLPQEYGSVFLQMLCLTVQNRSVHFGHWQIVVASAIVCDKIALMRCCSPAVVTPAQDHGAVQLMFFLSHDCSPKIKIYALPHFQLRILCKVNLNIILIR